MELDRAVCDRARKSRDARFDGRFFIAVTTTKIYCRPICPVRAPLDRNIRYYPTAAAAETARFRPCLRCRPEASPGTPAWHGTSGVVSRALRLIGEGALDREGVDRLSDRLGVTARHLRRLFVQHLGATPIEVALTRRVQSAKKLLDETNLSCTQIAIAAGFGSLRRFNGEIRRTYSRTPTELRRLRKRPHGDSGSYRFTLSYRPPYDWDALIRFLSARATPGVEAVDAAGYRRTIALGGKCGWMAVTRNPDAPSLFVDVTFPDPNLLLVIVERAKRMFDVGADPAAIGDQLAVDRQLRRTWLAHPGLRVAGAWDGFELTVRAILGQQISVAAATTIAGRIAGRWGTPIDAGSLTRIFPTPAQLADAPIEEAGVIGARARSIRALATAVAGGSLAFDAPGCLDVLRSLPGIGDWTAQYVAMRALNEPDAFLSGDLVLRRMAGGCSARELDALSEQWRPWRAYAVLALWQAATDLDAKTRRMRHAHVDSNRRLRKPAGRELVAAAG